MKPTLKTSKLIRSEFIQFFEKRGHTFVPSSSLLPADDPTLLFANAGMNQFKAIFLGTEKRDYTRAANSQKCIRAGGKHNDLEDVGHDVYHHTFFEMLGNWSFGDYFKKDAIAWAWELLTKVWHLPKDRLHVTVFGGDKEDGLPPDSDAENLWKKLTDIDPSHIHHGNKKDNFWAAGDTGPCGPCSEIHYDFTPDLSGGPLVNVGDPRVMEVWNLVFMQYNRDGDGKLSPLPATHVDTGMGLERVCKILQGKESNYAIDLFVPIIEKIETMTPHRYGAKALAAGAVKDRFDVLTAEDIGDVACRVVADHARALTFAIADGVIPSNEGRGYVLRRILRRAARYGRQYLQIEGPFICKLIPAIIELMGEAFPEIRNRQKYVTETIFSEEESFGKTLDRGIDLFRSVVEKTMSDFRKEVTSKGIARKVTTTKNELVIELGDGSESRHPIEDWAKVLGVLCSRKPRIGGDVAFELYATYGFPLDLTQIMAGELGLTVDVAGYEKAMEEHRKVSGAGGDVFKVEALVGLPATDDSAKYTPAPIEAKVLGWVAGGKFVDQGSLKAGDEAAVILDRTNFYGEQGGQVGDCGRLVFDDGKFIVRNTTLAGQCVLHGGVMEAGELAAGDAVEAQVDECRFDIMRNHTGTHLLNWALRKVLGDHINQAGSVVATDRLRFDFTHNQAVTTEQLAEIERLVNERVLDDLQVLKKVMSLAEAKKIPGVRAVFGEKYPDPVRVILVGPSRDPAVPYQTELPQSQHQPSTLDDYNDEFVSDEFSVEFCGGTHLGRTSEVGLFKILSEESVAKGVRRITAVTGHGAVQHVQELDAVVRAASGLLKAPAAELPDRITAMLKEIKQLRKGGGAGGGGAAGGFALSFEIDTPGGKIVVGRLDGGDQAAMRSACDIQRQKGAAAVFVGGVTEDKVTLVAMVSEDLVKAGKIKAGDWVKAIAPAVDGSGGGKPTLAQAGGKNIEKVPEALQQAAEWAKTRM